MVVRVCRAAFPRYPFHKSTLPLCPVGIKNASFKSGCYTNLVIKNSGGLGAAKRRLFGLLKKRRNHLGSLSMDYRVPPPVEEGHLGGGAFF